MSKPNLNVGEVEVDLGGETLVLRPTLRAAQSINRHFGSLRAALVQIGELNIEAYVAIIRHGAGVSDAGQRDLAEKVWKAGLTRLSGPVARFIAVLLNGGRPDDDVPAGEQEPAEGNA